jgi:excinuclease UvrABC nuclease subunit
MYPCIPTHLENLPQYKKNIRYITQFLKGKKENVIKLLLAEQKAYVQREEFEKAAEIQKQIDKINYITSETYHPFEYEEKPDHYFERIAVETDSLKSILNENGVPVSSLNIIECYDISNFQGKQATGSLVSFENGDANPAKYRRFKIRTKSTPDDFTMMKEVLGRRIKHFQDWGAPNLFVIDGGKGQVSSAVEILDKAGVKIPVIGLAKREEIIVVPRHTAEGLTFDEIKLPHSTPGINLLRRIRDEAHRFAITYHRLLRKKAFLS